MNERTNADPGLPTVAGGWELQRGPHVRLWVPKQPDALFDPDAEVLPRDYHGTMPYWAWVWEAAEPCVDALLQRDLRGRVLEVGAGLGAVGIALAAELGDRVRCTLSDYDALAVQACQVNVDLNHVHGTRVWNLDWRRLDEAPSGECSEDCDERFDVIIGCEVIYDPASHDALLDVIHRYLEPESGVARIFDPGRAPAKQFVRRAKKRGFSVTVEDMSGQSAAIQLGEPRWLVLPASCSTERQPARAEEP